jgi:hypothetical protein
MRPWAPDLHEQQQDSNSAESASDVLWSDVLWKLAMLWAEVRELVATSTAANTLQQLTNSACVCCVCAAVLRIRCANSLRLAPQRLQRLPLLPVLLRRPPQVQETRRGSPPPLPQASARPCTRRRRE